MSAMSEYPSGERSTCVIRRKGAPVRREGERGTVDGRVELGMDAGKAAGPTAQGAKTWRMANGVSLWASPGPSGV